MRLRERLGRWRHAALGNAAARAQAGGSPIRFAWDHPLPDAAIHGRTAVVDGWLLDVPPGTEVVVLHDGRLAAATSARHVRPDVAAGADGVCGFHVEVRLADVPPGGRATLTLGVRVPGDRSVRLLTERSVRIPDPAPLPYEDAFRNAEQRGVVLGRGDVYGSGPPIGEASPEMLDIARRHAGRRVLDLGCGAGPYALALARSGHEVHGVEYAAGTAALARATGLSILRADARRLPFADRSVDTVLAVEVLEHVPAPAHAVAECARIARRGLVVSVPNAAVIPHLFPWGVVPWHLLEATHVNFFSAGSLETLLRRGFPHVEVGFYARTYRFPDAPPLYAHLFAVASHHPLGA
jgi:SAM-dependent methyltransferase